MRGLDIPIIGGSIGQLGTAFALRKPDLELTATAHGLAQTVCVHGLNPHGKSGNFAKGERRCVRH